MVASIARRFSTTTAWLMNQCGCGATSALGTNRDRRRERRGSRVLRERSGVMKPALLMSARAPAALSRPDGRPMRGEAGSDGWVEAREDPLALTQGA